MCMQLLMLITTIFIVKSVILCPETIKYQMIGSIYALAKYEYAELATGTISSGKSHCYGIKLQEKVDRLCKKNVELLAPVAYFEAVGIDLISIEPGTFDNQNIQLIINLSVNILKKIGTKTFANMNVQEINLSHNKINTIEAGAFVNLSSLMELNLGTNKLLTISDWWKDLHLTRLDLSFNQISEIPPGVVGIVDRNYGVVNLSKNMIKTVKLDEFKNTNLKWIYLSSNLISEIIGTENINTTNRYWNFTDNPLNCTTMFKLHQLKMFVSEFNYVLFCSGDLTS